MPSGNDRYQGYSRRAVLAASGALWLAGVTGTAAGAQTQQSPPNVAWTQEYLHVSGEILAMHVAATSDGGYVLGGRAVGGGHRQFAVTKTDRGGSRQWTTLVDDGIDHTTQESWAVVETSDGGFVVAGYGWYGDEPGEYRSHTSIAEIGKVGPDGSRRWTKTYDAYEPDDTDDTEPDLGKEDSAMFLDTAGTGDGGVVAVGYRNTPCWAVKLDANGSVVWDLSYPDRNMFTQVFRVPDGGFVIIASPSEDDPFHAVHVTAGGSIRKRVSLAVDYGATLWGHTFTPTSDGGYAYTAQHSQGTDIVLGKLNASGAQQWLRTYDGPASGNDRGHDVLQTADGGFVVAGYVAVPTEEYRPALLKTSSDGTRQWLHVLTEPKAVVGDAGYATVVRGASGGFTALARPWLVSYGAGGGTTTPKPTTTPGKTRTETPTTTTTKKSGPGFGVLGALGALGGLLGAGYALRDESDD